MQKVFILISLFMSFFSFAQTKDELDLCMAIQANSFTSNTEAENALDRILDVIGASKNFVLTPCNKISNAVATAYKGTRYILYDRDFMNLISKNTNDWSNLFIFAHEVGHHINGHSIDLLLYTNDVVDAPSLEKSRKQELEADEFAAFVLAKLGANLSQLNNVITLISDNSDDTYSTHPKRSKRLVSVRNGFNKGYVKKETKTIVVDRTNLKYEKSSKFIRVGDWYKYNSNDPFNQFNLTITNGKVYHSSYKTTDKAPTFVTHGENGEGFTGLDKLYPKESKKLLDLNHIKDKDVSGPRYGKTEVKIIIYQNDKIIYDKTGSMSLGESTFNFDNRKEAEKILGDDINALTIYGLKYSLKKGTRMLVKFTKVYEAYNLGLKEWRYNGKDWKKFKTEHRETFNMHKNTYFEYSLFGSSKALAD